MRLRGRQRRQRPLTSPPAPPLPQKAVDGPALPSHLRQCSYVLAHAPAGKAALPETADITASASAATEAVDGPASHPI